MKGVEILQAMLDRFKQDAPNYEAGVFEVSQDIFDELNGMRNFKDIPILLNEKLTTDTAHLYEKEWYNDYIASKIKGWEE